MSMQSRCDPWTMICNNNNNLFSASCFFADFDPLHYPVCTISRSATNQKRKPLSPAQLLASSPLGVTLEELTLVYMYKSQAPVDLSCLALCPALHTLSLTKCAITAFAGVSTSSNPSLQDISLPVLITSNHSSFSWFSVHFSFCFSCNLSSLCLSISVFLAFFVVQCHGVA